MSNYSQTRITRRSLIGTTVPAAVGTLVFGELTVAQAKLTKVDEKDPQAVALGYVHDAKKVVPASNPTYKPGQDCENCMQLVGKVGDEWRPCNIFPMKLVHKDGWCRVWVKKPGT